MSESKHTPGPWVTEHGSLYDAITSADGDICTWNHLVGRSRPPQKANTRLIAAAPELLEAMRLALTEMEAMHAHHHPNCEGGCPYWEAHRTACAAIAKAEPDA